MSRSFIVDRHSAVTPTLEVIQSEKIPVYDTVADAEADLANLNVGQIVATKEVEKSLFDYIYPIGSTYTQYPDCASPNVLWPDTTWTELDFQGAFFRASGGNAQAFDEQTEMQTDMIRSHRHSMTLLGNVSDGWASASGWNWGRNDRGTETKYTSYEGGTETRPANYTIKIWKRTA